MEKKLALPAEYYNRPVGGAGSSFSVFPIL